MQLKSSYLFKYNLDYHNSRFVIPDTIFQNDDLHVSTYLAALDRKYGHDYLVFEPETLKSELNPTDAVLDKIQAGITLKTTSMFWNDIVVFEKVTLALNSRSVSFGEYQDISPGEMAWGVVEAGLIDKDKNTFSDDVKTYISKKLFDAGYVLAPFPLYGIQDALDEMTTQQEDTDREVQKSRLEAISIYIKQQLGTLLGELNNTIII